MLAIVVVYLQPPTVLSSFATLIFGWLVYRGHSPQRHVLGLFLAVGTPVFLTVGVRLFSGPPTRVIDLLDGGAPTKNITKDCIWERSPPSTLVYKQFSRSSYSAYFSAFERPVFQVNDPPTSHPKSPQ
ncbi:MAG: hypothetical protein ACJAZO_000841 [Myxococcota bacterium]|jgi:hypothetical protein